MFAGLLLVAMGAIAYAAESSTLVSRTICLEDGCVTVNALLYPLLGLDVTAVFLGIVLFLYSVPLAERSS